MAEGDKPLRFLIAGSVAVGSAFGAMLRLGGHEVTLLGRNRDHMREIGYALKKVNIKWDVLA